MQKRCKTQENKLIIASIKITKNIVLYSGYILSIRA